MRVFRKRIFLGDLYAKHRARACTARNTRWYDLLNAADDKALIFLNYGSSTHTSFSCGTSEALDTYLVSPELFLIVIGLLWTVLALTDRTLGPRTISGDLEQEWYIFKLAIINPSHKSIPRSNFRRLKFFFQRRNPELRNLILKRNDLHSSPELAIPSHIDAKAPNSKLSRLAQSLSYSQPQAVPCNTVLNPVGEIPHDGKAAANILGELYKNMYKLTFEQDDVLDQNKSKRLIHNCRSNRIGLPLTISH
ncbi:hypothetical protein TNIN_123731 [Trichonephila inaurata madagascariensis]|uniref:Uncharacterized protein n=1 Tax=Trichonephila inaurata madagascariensis TaxID=2747483 RepID=A0A8X6XWI3_9ARAC|nr:hypothetical protein TNIN_123731 [Trichonephila inaurata madagascariensis]